MRKSISWLIAVLALCTHAAVGQDDSDNLIRKALVGRHVLVKMDLPAINSGVDFVLDNTDVSYNSNKCNNLLKQYGVAVKNGTKSRITDVRVSNRGIELDLDGGGMPTHDWVVGSLKLVEPEPMAKSDREVELERQVASDTSPSHAVQLRADLEYERQRRLAQDERNREAFRRAESLRRQYIDENRANWGSKVVVVIRSRKESVKMRDMVKALAKYVELLPSEKPAE
jgi:hypothetical protein